MIKLARLDGCSLVLVAALVVALLAAIVGGAKWLSTYGAEPIEDAPVASAAAAAPAGNPELERAVRAYYAENFRETTWYASILNVSVAGRNLWVRTSVDPNTADGQAARGHICGASRAMRPFVEIPGNIYVLDRNQRNLCIV